MTKHLPIFSVITFLLCSVIAYFAYPTTIQTDNLYRGVSNNSLEDYYLEGRQTKNLSTTTEVNFLAVGDIMLSRDVAGQIKRNGTDANWPFHKLSELLVSTDFNFGNLESPFSGRDDYTSVDSLTFNAPTWTQPGLINANFKVLNLANNHAFDQGLNGLLHTKKLLEEDMSITPVGTGNNLGEAWEGKIYNARGVRIGFVGASFASLNDGGVTKNNHIARIEDTKQLVQSINELKTRSDFIVITMHAGTEYTRSPNTAQIEFAHRAIDAGADLVIGAHPHWIQPIETYKGKQIFYSLGNFVFDQEWSHETKEGLVLKIAIEKSGTCNQNLNGQQQVACADSLQGSNTGAKLKQIELLPIIIENYGQPRLANEIEKQRILKKIDVTTSVITP